MIKRIAKTVDIKQKFKDTIEAVKIVARIADEKKADYVKILDMRSRLIITDYFIIISARNTRLTRKIEEEIRIHLKSINRYPINASGLAEGNWILVDYDDFVIHIFTNQFREYYQLEKLWRDSKEIKWN